MTQRLLRKTTTVVEEILDPEELYGLEDAEDPTEPEEDEPEDETADKPGRRRRR